MHSQCKTPRHKCDLGNKNDSVTDHVYRPVGDYIEVNK